MDAPELVRVRVWVVEKDLGSTEPITFSHLALKSPIYSTLFLWQKSNEFD